MEDWKAHVVWPAEGYWPRGEDHARPWTDLVTDEDGEVHGDYTYKDLVGDLAESVHMTVSEYLGSMRYSGAGVLDEDEGDEDW